MGVSGAYVEAAAVSEPRVGDFRDFFAAEYPAVAGYARSLVGPDTADEVAQEAMTRVYARWPLMREPRAYAFRIATNLARDRWRRDAREQTLWETAVSTREPRADGPDPVVWDAVSRLPDRLRSVVLLHYVADLPLADVATALHRPLGTVKRRLHEARRLLAVALEDTP